MPHDYSDDYIPTQFRPDGNPLLERLLGTERKKRGRKPDPNKLVFRSVGLTAEQWAFVRQWASENDSDTNYTPALGTALEEFRRFLPTPTGRARDERGRFCRVKV